MSKVCIDLDFTKFSNVEEYCNYVDTALHIVRSSVNAYASSCDFDMSGKKKYKIKIDLFIMEDKKDV